jgi:hypothetical protein
LFNNFLSAKIKKKILGILIDDFGPETLKLGFLSHAKKTTNTKLKKDPIFIYLLF